MLVKIDPEVVEGGDFALRKDASGEVRVVRNLDPNWQFTAPLPPLDIWDLALRVGNDGKIRLFERFSLLEDGRGGFEMLPDPFGPYILQLDSMGERRLVVDPAAPGADPLLDLDRFSIRDRDGGFLLLPLRASDPDVVRRRPDNPLEVLYDTLKDPDADVGPWLNGPMDMTDPLGMPYSIVGVPFDGPRRHGGGVPDVGGEPYAVVGKPGVGGEPYAVVGKPGVGGGGPYAVVGVPNVVGGEPYAVVGMPTGGTRHLSVPPPDLDVTEVLDGVEDAGRGADNLGAVEPPVRTLDDTGASAGARLDQQGARWETPADPVEFSNEGHPGPAGGSARLAEPEANSHFHGAVGPDPTGTQPPPPLPEGVVGSGSSPGLPSDFDTDRAIARLDERINQRNHMIGRAKLQGIEGDDLRRLEAERDACEFVVAELRADRDPRAALQAQAMSMTDPFLVQALTNLHVSLDNRSALFYPQGLHADVLAVVDGKVPPSVDTSDLVARWREMAQNMLAFRADQTDPDVVRRGELYGEVEMAMRDAIAWVRRGLDPTDMLQQRIVALEARTLADGTTGAAEANMLRGMVRQYRNLVEGSIGSLHLSPEWLAAVSNLRDAERGGDLGATDEAWSWLNLLTSPDGRGVDNLEADDFADGTLINQMYADDMAVLDGRLPPSLDTSNMAEGWLAHIDTITDLKNRLYSNPQTDVQHRKYVTLGDLQGAINEAVMLGLRHGEDPTDRLQRRIAEFDRAAQAGDNDAAETAVDLLRSMVEQFQHALDAAVPNRRAAPLAGVARHRLENARGAKEPGSRQCSRLPQTAREACESGR